jgi:beta-lactamase regulating signal transducer with metallopeptidase domain
MSFETIGWLLVQATILLTAALLVDRLLARRFVLATAALWDGVAAGLLVLPVATFILPRWELPVLPPLAATESDQLTVPRSFVDVEGPSVETMEMTPAAMDRPRVAHPTNAPRANNQMVRHVMPPTAPAWRLSVPVLTTSVYAGGVALAVARLLLSWRAVTHLRHRAIRVTQLQWIERFDAVRDRLRLPASIALLASDDVAVPVALGIFCRAVVIPTAMMDERRRPVIDAVLVHELAHVRRADCRWQLLQRLAQAMWWFHPLVWLTGLRIALARERACDDFAIGVLDDRIAYVRTLVEISAALARATPRQSRGLMALTMAVVWSSNLERRLASIERSTGSSRCAMHLVPRMALLAGIATTALSLGVIALGRATAEPGAQTDSERAGAAPDPAQPPATPPAGALSLVAEVVDVDGRPLGRSTIAFWREVPPNEAAEEFDWHDSKTGKSWRQISGAATGSSMTADRLLPGVYRVTARAGHHLTAPFGMSDPVVLDGSQNETKVTVRLLPGSSLLVRAVDEQSGQPVGKFGITITRARNDFPPGWSITTGAADKSFALVDGLPPGQYQIAADRRAASPDDWQYTLVDGPARVEMEPGKNRELELKLRATRLTDEEIAKQWPWYVTGEVVDDQGRPVAGATVRAATGMGTLLGGGRTTTGADGRYTLRFGPGMWTNNPAFAQAALFFASKPGYFEKNLNRQGAFAMAREKPVESVWGQRDVILPNQPREINFVLAPAASLETEFLDSSGEKLWDNRVTLVGQTMPPGSSVIDSGQIRPQGDIRFEDVPVGIPWWLGLMIDRRTGIRSPSFVLARPGHYRMTLQHLRHDATGLDLLHILSIRDPLGQEVLAESKTDDPLWQSFPSAEDQARARDILKRLGEVNRYWLAPPPVEVKNYSYDFKMADGKTQAYNVDDPQTADRRVRMGIQFASTVLRLVENRDKLVFRAVEITPERIRLTYHVTTASKRAAGNGVRGPYNGYSDGPVTDGTIVIDPVRWVPLEAGDDPRRSEPYRETFDDYVEIGPGCFVPRKVKILRGDRVTYGFDFQVYQPGLWLLSESRNTRDPGGPPLAKIENVIVNGAAATPLE